MAALPYMKFYVGDYLADTMHLSTIEHGAYLMIIMHYWRTGKPIEVSHIPSICGLSKRQFNNMKNTLLAFFLVDEVGKVRHPRIEKELNQAKIKVNQRKAAGKASAAKRAAEKPSERSTSVESSLGVSLNENGNTRSNKPEPEPEPEPEKRIKPLHTSPDEQLVTELAKKEGLDLDGFFVFYENNDWHVGRGSEREPIVNWQAVARRWSERKRTKPFDDVVGDNFVGAKDDTSWRHNLGD